MTEPTKPRYQNDLVRKQAAICALAQPHRLMFAYIAFACLPGAREFHIPRRVDNVCARN